MSRIDVHVGDITTLAVDAIVNAANERMLGGGGVDGAIHAAAGPELLEACRAVSEVAPGVRCPTGEARLTPGFGLPARYVIHTVGPVWSGGKASEEPLLDSCYEQSLTLAIEHELKTIAFPAISTGVYGYPLDRAASVAVQAIARTIDGQDSIQRVTLVAFEPQAGEILQRAVADFG